MGIFTRKDRYEPYRKLPEDELLNAIQAGDQLAEQYLMETFSSAVSAHMGYQLGNKPDQLGEPDDYVHDALLLLLSKARSAGSAVLKHDYSTINGWLKQAATNFLRAATRKDKDTDREDWQPDGDDDGCQSILESIEDKGADAFVELISKDRYELVRQVLDMQIGKLQTLIRLKFMEGFSWEETAQLMIQLYPDNDPPFNVTYLQRTYWDRVHKRPFCEKLIDAFNRYGYDLRRKR
ncbi:RNA polymerase sigma factor [Fibrella forsythiae]|uniref:Sigma-70 family RNA polymerase sigma factor n=1 Tax=Fibrella forsythiae TaxID=2817061 RepID=A0ABS3JLP0_9BACT|nr:hypothetical protein [Fibrella forsythiae]MBO0950914.1 hypothetical protein [Fibrella forsythiae]